MLNEFNFIFNNDQIHIEFDQNNMTWFYGPEIAKVLEYDSPHHMYRIVLDNERREFNTRHNSAGIPSRGNPNIIIINEPGLYRCIFNSRSPRAVEFQNKVFYDILPSIRQYGAYIDPDTRAQLQQDPNYINNLVNKITELENKPHNKLMTAPVDKSFGIDKRFEDLKVMNREQFKYIKDNANYVTLGQAVAEENGDITIDMLAHILQKKGYPTGTNRMYEELRNDGFLNKYNGLYNHPNQSTIDAGLMRWCTVTDATGIYNKVFITPKGQEYFINFYLNKLVENKN